MGAVKQVLVPDIGDFDEVDVIEVLVASGDSVAKEDSLITLESDKATMDVPAPFPGKVQDVKVKAGDKIGEGALILTLEVEEQAAESAAGTEAETPSASAAAASDGSDTDDSARAGEPSGSIPATPEAAATPMPQQPESALDPAAFSKAYASPSVRRFARELGVDLTKVRGSGRKSRILKEDVQAFVKRSLAEPAAAGAGLPEVPVIDFSRFGETERIELSRIQKIAGPRLHASWVNLPHVTQNDEADITDLEEFRQAQKAAAKERGVSLTPLAFIMKAVVTALREFPTLNASLDVDHQHLVLKRYYHLGFAVDTPGGLVVPVIKDVDRKGILTIAGELGEISAAAREGKLKPDQIQGASFTISSLGSIGGSYFTPIINAPEVAILGVARARMMPVWQGSEFVPRLILPLSLSYDHRVVDGATGVRFTTYLAKLLSDIRSLAL
jgi:pyruvate dehydrogenase E2 component (dihydrolipoamide acetyltransferase)